VSLVGGASTVVSSSHFLMGRIQLLERLRSTGYRLEQKKTILYTIGDKFI
jgi:hypothetical protein